MYRSRALENFVFICRHLPELLWTAATRTGVSTGGTTAPPCSTSSEPSSAKSAKKYFKPGIRQCKWWVESQVNRGDSLGEYPSPVIKLLNKFLVLMWIKFEHFWVVIFSGNSNSTRPAFSQVPQRTRRAGSLTILLYEWCDEHLSCGNEFHWTNN